ncbi:MAG: UDP-2,4-diacetamido-2,4,6-trideoxy-beta-L-altropyranose hydrolase [Bacteriovoracaceae bacterium]|jgi:UDP-2,4-diacetamido-2,4,6-trideoxy-beta-L-altropyranose hydrolase
MTIYFRVDANSKIGFGHGSRCLSLARMLHKYFTITFLHIDSSSEFLNQIETAGFSYHKLDELELKNQVQEINKLVKPNDVIVVDGYQYDTAYLSGIICKCAYIDDVNDKVLPVDLIINHNVYAPLEKYQCKNSTILALGSEYSLLNPIYLNAATQKSNEINKLEKILVCMGGADKENSALEVLKILKNSFPNLSISVVCPNQKNLKQIESFSKDKEGIELLATVSNEKMLNLMQSNHLMICPASVMVLEACAAGIPLYLGIIADNQIKNAKYLKDQGIGIYCEWFNKLNNETLSNSIQGLIDDPNALNIIVKRQASIIDNKTEQRIIDLFNRLTISDQVSTDT